MTAKQLILATITAATALLSGAVVAQTATDDAAAAQADMREKIDAATAADDKFHANRTEANMRARDQAEAEAAAAIKAAHEKMDEAQAVEPSGASTEEPR
jgi:Na+-translocating ferredoxin:NAD+ oxidoreductase RnfG subunit